MLSPEAIGALDRAHAWHPYTTWPPAVPPYVVREAHGAEIVMAGESGSTHTVVDAMASWWSAIHGYRHPVLDSAAAQQLATMSHVMFGGLTHEPAAVLCQRLAQLLPGHLDHVFLCDSGSVAVEVAMKMALQACTMGGRPQRTRFLTWRGGYHGDTFMAMSVCDPDGGMHSLWEGVLPLQVFADAPPDGQDLSGQARFVEHLESLVRRHRHELAAVIVEPVVQGAGGMRFHSPAVVKALRDITVENDVLLVLDEVATGFGRTGLMFACQHAGICPDIICLGKAMTGGYLSLAAAVCTTDVAARISASGAPALMHGPTFMGNPLACAIANASLDILAEGAWRQAVVSIGSWLEEGLAPARSVKGVRDVRVLGAIGVIELDHPVDVAGATTAALAGGVWLRPFRDLVYAMPAYIVDEEQARRIGAAMVAAAAQG